MASQEEDRNWEGQGLASGRRKGSKQEPSWALQLSLA